MRKFLNLVYLSMIAIVFASCDSNEENLPTTAVLTTNFQGLETLGANFVYEGWLIVNGKPVSTGTFTSVQFPQTFVVNSDDLNNATTFVLSVEPAVDPDPAPASTKILAGDFSGKTANVNSDNIVVAADSSIKSFNNSWGKYILATPTDSDDSNEASGVWFLDNSGSSPIAGLGLPKLTEGWKYEGWVVLNGTPISTGTFTQVNVADDNFSSSPYKGTVNSGPPFPGEDYLRGAAGGVNFPTDLKGATIVVSIEPFPDNSSAPFTLKPLAHMVPTNAMNHTVLTMGKGPLAVLSGTVSR